MCRRTRKSLDFRIREQHKNFWLEQSFQDRYGGREVGGEVGGWLMKYLILPACVGAGTLLYAFESIELSSAGDERRYECERLEIVLRCLIDIQVEILRV